jgi:uncharacterized protein (TIGR02271 family)
MEIHASEPAGVEPAPDPGVDRPVAHEGDGIASKIARFFGNLFDGDEPPAEVGHYQEAVRRGGAILTVTVLDETHVRAVFAAMHEAGAVDIDERVTQWQNTGYKGYDPAAAQYSADEVAAERQSFAVVRESLDVGKREVQTGGVRVYSVGTETPASESVSLRDTHATIERHAVDRIATADDLKTDAVEVQETAEQAVVAKTAHVVEEVVVGRQATEREETINETLRGTDVKVERTDDHLADNGAADAGLTSTEVETRKRP